MKWKSKGITISESGQHKGMFILDYLDGKFININSSLEQMLKSHPIDAVMDKRRPTAPRFTIGNDVATYGNIVRTVLLCLTIILGSCNQKLYNGTTKRVPVKEANEK